VSGGNLSASSRILFFNFSRAFELDTQAQDFKCPLKNSETDESGDLDGQFTLPK
jgi:hypothetical protein